MPSGVILSSGSQGATQEAIEKVLEANGYEADKPEEQPIELTEPKREDFGSDTEFQTAQEEYETKLEEQEEQREEEERARQPKPSRRQRAVEKATKDLRKQLEEANARLAALEGKKPAETAAPKIEQPKRDDFKSDAEYEEAMFDYRYKLRRAKEAVDEARSAQETRLKETFETYQSSVAAFKEEHDDWDEVVNQKLPIHESVYLAVIEQENGPQVTYYLGKHPDFVTRLAEMTPLSAVMEIGRLADRLKVGKPAEEKPKTKPRTNLPAPVTPVSTSATASTLTSRDAAAKRDFRAFKAAQKRGA